jgi:hypothetical protein
VHPGALAKCLSRAIASLNVAGCILLYLSSPVMGVTRPTDRAWSRPLDRSIQWRHCSVLTEPHGRAKSVTSVWHGG